MNVKPDIFGADGAEAERSQLPPPEPRWQEGWYLAPLICIGVAFWVAIVYDLVRLLHSGG